MAIDYTEPVINDLGLNILAPGGIGSYSPDAMRWDCNIGGYNFLYATNEQFPMQRQTPQHVTPLSLTPRASVSRTR